MKTSGYLLLALVALGCSLAVSSLSSADGGGGGGGQAVKYIDPDFSRATKAIDGQDWTRAIELLNSVISRDKGNADAYNLLGFAERKSGHLDSAFQYYQQALTLNPKHRGAHEYIGEAYLLAGDLGKAQQHLAQLDKLCFFSCEEYRDLKKAIDQYRQKQPQ